MTLLHAALVMLAELVALAAVALAFHRFAPVRWVRERHDLALGVFLLSPFLLAFALLPAPPEPLATSTEVLSEAVLALPTPEAVSVAPSATNPGAKAGNSGIPLPVVEIVLGLWLIGTAWMLLRLGVDIVRQVRLKVSATAIAPPSLILSAPIEIRRSDAIRTPLFAGFLWPCILVPRDFTLDEEALPVLEHEVAHKVRGDAWIALGIELLLAAFWWAVPLYALKRVVGRNREILCDQQAATVTQAPERLAHALLDAARIHARTPPFALAVSPEGSTLAARVRHLATHFEPPRRTHIMRFALVFPSLLVSFLIISPRVGIAHSEDWEAHEHDTHEHEQHDHDHDSDVDDPLFRAAARGDLDRVSDLLREGADPNIVSEGDGTALMAAVRVERTDIVRELLDHGSDPNLKAPGDGTALIAAARNGNTEIAELLIAGGADVDLGITRDGAPLISASSKGDRRMVELLLRSGADSNVAVPGDGNPLIAASLRGHVEIVKILIDADADPNGFVLRDETPLINAAQQGHIDVAEVLVQAGADVSLTVPTPHIDREVNEEEKAFRSPLSEAKRNGKKKMVEWLEARGAEHRPE